MRKASGAELAREAPGAADVVVRCPIRVRGDRLCAGIGIPTEPASSAITVGRTFIEPTQHIRQLGVRLKHSANRAVVAGSASC